MAEDLEHFIKTMALGIPTIKPDEKRAFFGEFSRTGGNGSDDSPTARCPDHRNA